MAFPSIAHEDFDRPDAAFGQIVVQRDEFTRCDLRLVECSKGIAVGQLRPEPRGMLTIVSSVAGPDDKEFVREEEGVQGKLFVVAVGEHDQASMRAEGRLESLKRLVLGRALDAGIAVRHKAR